MAPEDNPADDDEHGECRQEIERVDSLLSDSRNQTRLAQEELSAVRWQAQKDNLRAELADTYEQWLLDIGKLTGCGHVDERLPRCIEEEFEKLLDESKRLHLENAAQLRRIEELVSERNELKRRADLWEKLHDARVDEGREQLEGFDCSAGFAPIQTSRKPWARYMWIEPNTSGYFWLRWTGADGIYRWLHPTEKKWVEEPHQIDMPLFPDRTTAMRAANESPEPPTWREYAANLTNREGRREAALKQSYDDLAASGGIVDAP